MEAVAHYEEQGSPFVTVSVLETSLWVHAVQPSCWERVAAETEQDRALISLAQIERALREEARRG